MGKTLVITPDRIAASEYIPLSVVANKKYLPASRRTLRQMCEDGVFKSAMKIGRGGKTSKWIVLRSETLQIRINNHACPQY